MHNAILEPAIHRDDLSAERELVASPVIASADISPSVVPLIEADDIQPSWQEATSRNVEPATVVNRTPKHRSKTAPNRREATARSIVEHGSEVRLILVAVDEAEIPSDEPTLLLADNRRLKLLLVEHLRREKAQLEQMLKRFEAN